MALSPDGTSLAADIGRDYIGTHLIVFDLATGNERAWSFKSCASCHPSGGGLGFAGTNVDALSWTATVATSRSSGLTAPGGRHTARSGCST